MQYLKAYTTSLAAIYGDMTIEQAYYRGCVQIRLLLEEQGLDFRDVVQSKIDKKEDDPPF